MIRADLTIEMPDEELEAFLQALRGWERARPEIKLMIGIEARHLSGRAVGDIFARLQPPFPWTELVPFKDYES